MSDKVINAVMNPMVRVPLTASGYVEPTGEDYHALKQMTGCDGMQMAAAIGVTQSAFRTYFRAKNINKGRGIPYYHWRFLIEATSLESPVLFKKPELPAINESVFSASNWTPPKASDILQAQKLLGVKDITLCRFLGFDLEGFQAARYERSKALDTWFANTKIVKEDWFSFLAEHKVETVSDVIDVKKRLNPAMFETLRSGGYEPPTPNDIRAVMAAYGVTTSVGALVTGLWDEQLDYHLANHSHIMHKVRPRKGAYQDGGWEPPRHDDLKVILKITDTSLGELVNALGVPAWEKNKLELNGHSRPISEIKKEDWFAFLIENGLTSYDVIMDKVHELEDEARDNSRPDPFFEEEINPIPYSAWRLMIQAAQLVEPEKI